MSALSKGTAEIQKRVRTTVNLFPEKTRSKMSVFGSQFQGFVWFMSGRWAGNSTDT